MVGDPHRQNEWTEPGNDQVDTELLSRINRGDRDAFHSFYVKYYHPVLRFAYRVTRQLELAQEVVNDVMLVVWRDGRSFAGRSSVSTWVMGIAYRRALKLAEKSRRWYQRYAVGDFEEATERLVTDEEPTQRAELEDLLEQGLALLPPEQRAVVELTYFFGCSYEEISVISGCPVNTVKTRMFHARAKLRKSLPQLGKDDVSI